MPPTTHARLSPSAAYRWTECTGSPRLIESLAERDQTAMEVTADNEYVVFGVAAHDYAENLLTDSGNTVTVEPDIDAVVRPYVEYVRARVAEGSMRLAVEQRVSLSGLHPPEPIFGTPDAQLFSPDVLEIVDLKTGQGVPVDAVGNKQLILYAAGALEAYHGAAPHEVRLTIVQPRAGGINTWTTTPTEVMTLAQTYVAAAWDVGTDMEVLRPGTWCRFCPAQAHCPALKEHAQIVTQMDFDVVPVDTPPPPELVPIDAAADILRKVAVLESWFNALRQRVQRELEAGRPVPGWKLVLKRPQRVWNSVEGLYQWARDANVEESALVTHGLKSPAQIEQLVGKKNLPPELYTAVSSGVTLVPESDRRPAIAVGPSQDFAALPPAAIDVTIAEDQE